jgi:hypothetical protein
MLANEVLGRALSGTTQHTGPSLLPLENSVVLINNTKITSNVAMQIRSLLDRVDAKKFYMKAMNCVKGSNKEGLGWSPKAFEAVDWEALAKAILGWSEGFQLWLSKQAIEVCTMQKNTACIQDILDDRCPNWGKRGEDNHHLNQCVDPGCVCLFKDGVRKLTKWMRQQNQTDTELTFWIQEYLIHRGQVQMTNLATLRQMSAALREAAESQDMIGWIEFLHSRVSTKFWPIKHVHCIIAGIQISRDDWMTQFTRQLLDMSHAQWLYRNFTLHHYAKGYLHQRMERDIEQEVEILADSKPTDIPKESRYLLETSFKPTKSTSAVGDAYWVLAMKATKNYLLM